MSAYCVVSRPASLPRGRGRPQSMQAQGQCRTAGHNGRFLLNDRPGGCCRRKADRRALPEAMEINAQYREEYRVKVNPTHLSKSLKLFPAHVSGTHKKYAMSQSLNSPTVAPLAAAVGQRRSGRQLQSRAAGFCTVAYNADRSPAGMTSSMRSNGPDRSVI